MSYCLISAMIVVVTYAILYAICARKTKSNQEFSAIEKGLLKGCLASLGLLALPIFGNLAFPKLQPQLTAVIFVVELAAIAVYSLLEFRKLSYRKVKLVCIVALFVGITPVWWQLFSYFQMKHDILNIMDFAMVTFLSWLAAIVVVTFTYLGGPKLRAKKKSKTETEDAKLLRKQLERLQNEYSALQRFNEELTETILMDTIQRGTPELKSESVTEDKKAESNLPKNTQAEEESTTKVEEAQTTASAPKSDAEDKPKVKVEVTNPSMTGVQQQKLSEILNRLGDDPSLEAQQAAIEEIVKNYRSATAKEATAPEEETSSQESEFAGFGLFFEVEDEEEPEDEEEEEALDPVDGNKNWEDDTILPDLFTVNNLVRAAFVVAIIFVVYAIVRV